MNKRTIRYTDDFRKEVIQYALNSNRPVTEICRHFDITTSSFYLWKKDILGDDADGQGAAEEGSGVSKETMMDQIRSLQIQLARKERDLEILKKATLILGNDPQ